MLFEQTYHGPFYSLLSYHLHKLFLGPQSWEIFSLCTAAKPAAVFVTFRCLLTCTAARPGIVTLCNFIQQLGGGMHKEFICFWAYFISLLKQLDLEVINCTHTQLRPTRPLRWQSVLQSFQNTWRSHILPYISWYLFHTQCKPVSD